MADLIDSDYVVAVHGEDIADLDRVDALIGSASNLVREYCRQPTWTADTAPETVKAVVANMVCDTINASGGKGSLRAEQVGDYRYENQSGRLRGLDIGPYEDTLARYRIRSYSVVTPIALDNPTYGGDDDEASEGDSS